MGKTKQQTVGKVATKKFDRNVEISAPILDAETIRAIHSPPKDKKLDIRHGGFKALLSDLNSQDSMEEPAPISENHQPSYIGISCAVSGYSNYSSYNRRPLEEMAIGGGGGHETSTKAARLTPSNASNSRLTATPNRSNTSSPMMLKQRANAEHQQQHINHVTIDKSTMGSADQERKELTEKLTASATERRRAPSPLPPPIEDGRHHGAYVGARYFPMPEPSKIVHKHIPLLGIDDDQDPDEFVAEDTNKVEKQIANLYGEEFVEDWKESMSHKAKKELPGDETAGAEKQSSQAMKNHKDLVTLKPTPPHVAPPKPAPVDVPTPDVKVLAGVEKQFLNRLLTDENPPMPRSPSPQAAAPGSPRFSRPIMSPTSSSTHPHTTTQMGGGGGGGKTADAHDGPLVSPAPTTRQPKPSPPKAQEPPVRAPTPVRTPTPVRAPTPEAVRESSPAASPATAASPTPAGEEDMLIEQAREMSPPPAVARDSPVSRSPTPEMAPNREQSPASIGRDSNSLIRLTETIAEEVEPAALRDDIITLDDQLNAQISTPVRADLPVSPSSHDSVKSSSTVEEVGAHHQAGGGGGERREQHIEYEIRAQSPMDNESSPVRTFESDEVPPAPEAEANLVSFSPEPIASEHNINNNNNDDDEAATAKVAAQLDLTSDADILLPQQQANQPTEQAAAGEAQAASEVAQTTVAQATQMAAAAGATSDGDGVVRDGRYFLSILEKEESFIMERARLAEAELAEHESDWNEETIGRVRSAVGKAHLLINKKCNQFRELCEKSLVNDASDQYAVLNDDLAGFWDMISIQIADVRKSFEALGCCQQQPEAAP